MNREVKYKIWNGDKMIDPHKTTPLALDKDLKIDGLFLPFADDYVLLQWINYKDFYEGDILENPYNERGVIVWHNCGFYLKCKRRNKQILYIELNHGFLENKKLVGNIHQNPELLTDLAIKQ